MNSDQTLSRRIPSCQETNSLIAIGVSWFPNPKLWDHRDIPNTSKNTSAVSVTQGPLQCAKNTSNIKCTLVMNAPCYWVSRPDVDFWWLLGVRNPWPPQVSPLGQSSQRVASLWGRSSGYHKHTSTAPAAHGQAKTRHSNGINIHNSCRFIYNILMYLWKKNSSLNTFGSSSHRCLFSEHTSMKGTRAINTRSWVKASSPARCWIPDGRSWSVPTFIQLQSGTKNAHSTSTNVK